MDDNFPECTQNTINLVGNIVSDADLVVTDAIMAQAFYHIDLSNTDVVTISHNKILQGNSGLDEKFKTYESYLLTHSDLIITPSQDIHQEFPEKSTLIFPGADGPFEHIPDVVDTSASRELVFVGSISQHKGFEFILELMKNLDEYSLLVVGGFSDPYYENRVRQLVTDYGLEEQIQFLGLLPQQNLAPVYTNAHGMVVASQFESYGIAISEAIYAACPVIMPRIGIPHFLESLAITAKFGIEAFEQTIYELEDPALYSSLKDFLATERVHLPTWELMKTQCQDILHELG